MALMSLTFASKTPNKLQLNSLLLPSSNPRSPSLIHATTLCRHHSPSSTWGANLQASPSRPLSMNPTTPLLLFPIITARITPFPSWISTADLRKPCSLHHASSSMTAAIILNKSADPCPCCRHATLLAATIFTHDDHPPSSVPTPSPPIPHPRSAQSSSALQPASLLSCTHGLPSLTASFTISLHPSQATAAARPASDLHATLSLPRAAHPACCLSPAAAVPAYDKLLSLILPSQTHASPAIFIPACRTISRKSSRLPAYNPATSLPMAIFFLQAITRSAPDIADPTNPPSMIMPPIPSGHLPLPSLAMTCFPHGRILHNIPLCMPPASPNRAAIFDISQCQPRM